MICYDPLWATMERRGMTQYRLIKQHSFSAGQIGRLKKNMHVSTHTLDTLCTILECGISDLVEYIPEGGAPGEPAAPGEPIPPPAAFTSQAQEPLSPGKQKKNDPPKNAKPKKSGKSKKNDKKTGKEGKRGKDSKKNK